MSFSGVRIIEMTEPEHAALLDRIAELEAELAFANSQRSQDIQRLAAVIALCDARWRHWNGDASKFVDRIRAAATGESQ